MSLLEKLKDIIGNTLNDIASTANIDSEGYPHGHYVSNFDYSYEDFLLVVDNINLIAGVTTNYAKLIPKSIQEIQSEITLSNYYSFKELTEVDCVDDYDSDPKYCYHTIIFRYLDTEQYLSIIIQRSGDVDLDITFGGTVKKQAVTTYQWV